MTLVRNENYPKQEQHRSLDKIATKQRTLVCAIVLTITVSVICVVLIVLGVHMWDFGKHRKPHIIIFLADDLGWSDVSFQNAYQIPTPNLDAMCADGVQLHSHYSQPACTPSRGALMTGKYPIRLGLQEHVLRAGTRDALSLKHTLLPEYLKRLGYSTHLVGKWHLGYYDPVYLPQNRGFDSFYGYYNGAGGYYDHAYSQGIYMGRDWHENGQPQRDVRNIYTTDLITGRVKSIIRAHNKNQPMFLMIAHMSPHGAQPWKPYEIDAKWWKDPQLRHVRNPNRTHYAGMVRSLDAAFGETVAALNEADMLDNAVILFSSDNGAPSIYAEKYKTGGSNWPFRGQKFSLWEGGSRVPSFIWSPLLKTRRYLNRHLYHFTDWLPTFVRLAGGDLSILAPDLDGHDIWASLRDNSKSPRETLLVNYDTGGHDHFAVRKGSFKLINGKPPSTPAGWWNEWYSMPGGAVDNVTVLENAMKSSQVYKILSRRRDFKEREAKWREASQIHCKIMKSFVDSPRGHSYGKYSFQDMMQASHVEDGLPCENPTEGPCLFNLDDDPCELMQYSGNDRHDIIKELTKIWIRLKAVTIAPIAPWANRSYHFDPASNPNKHHGFWVPWVNVQETATPDVVETTAQADSISYSEIVK